MAQKEAELNDKYVHLQEMELHAKTAFRNSLRKSLQHSKQLAQREAQCVSERETLEAEKEKLRQRGRCSKGGNQRDRGMPMKGRA